MRCQIVALIMSAVVPLELVIALPVPVAAQSFDGFVSEQAYDARPPTSPDGYIAPNASETRSVPRPQQFHRMGAAELQRTPPVLEASAPAISAGRSYTSLVTAIEPTFEEEEEEDNFDDDAEIAAVANGMANASCGTGSSYAGFEFVSLFPNGSEYVEIDFHTGLNQLPHIPFGAHPKGDAFDLTRPWGFRVWGGAENCCGQGVRFTYWQWDDEANGGGFDFDADLNFETVSRNIDIWTIDIEGTQSMYYGSTKMLGSLGLRLADFDYSATYGETILILPLTHNSAQEFFGYGVTAAFEGRRPLPCFPCWEGFAKLRGSLLFGNSDISASGHNFQVYDDIDINFDIAGQVKYQTWMVWETQIGVERQWCTSFGTMFVRAAFEAQLWEIPPTRGVADLNLGLVGNTFGIGFTR